MKMRTVSTVLAVATIVSLLLIQMVIVGEASTVSKGKPPTRTPRPSGSSGCGQAPPTVPGMTETQYMVYDDLNRKYNIPVFQTSERSSTDTSANER